MEGAPPFTPELTPPFLAPFKPSQYSDKKYENCLNVADKKKLMG